MYHPALDVLALPSDRPDPAPSIVVRQIADDDGWGHARALLLEYLEWVGAATGIDPYTVQPWLRDELRHLSQWYAPPCSLLLLATVNGIPSGVVGLTTHDGGWAELKRLYVTPAARGHRLGEHLVRAALAEARSLGCHSVRLETLPGLMDHAIALYERLGFGPTERFDTTAIDGLLYLERPATPPDAPTPAAPAAPAYPSTPSTPAMPAHLSGLSTPAAPACPSAPAAPATPPEMRI